MTAARSTPPADLVEQVRALAAELGEWPSVRRVMRTCGVGAPRATAALDALLAERYNPAPAPALAVVPDAPEVHPERTRERAQVHPQTRAPGAPETHPERTEAHAPSAPADAPAPAPADTPADAPADAEAQVKADADAPKRVPRWPLLVIALGAFVAIWSGWVGLGKLTGFGPVVLLPGIADDWTINSAIVLPLGVEAYAAYAMWVWLSDAPTSAHARTFARWSALGALALGAAGQIAYHLMVAAGMTAAPWQITAFVSCLPVVVLGCGAALAHLTHTQETA